MSKAKGYQPAPKPPSEAERLASLRKYEVLDSNQENEFGDFTELAAFICDTPIALISLVDTERQWFLSKKGLAVSETPRDMAFCAHTILTQGTMSVEDAKNDLRFAQNPLVTDEPYIRFYCGAPLVTPDGHKLGTLCVIDQKPRSLTEEQQKALRQLASAVVGRMERIKTLRHLSEIQSSLIESTQRLNAILEHAPDAIITICGTGEIESFNQAAESMFGCQSEYAIGRSIGELISDLPISEMRGEADSAPHTAAMLALVGNPMESLGRNLDGRHFPIRIKVSQMAPHGRQLFVLMISDQTEVKRLEQLKNDFVSSVSHELRTPLTSISGALGLLVGGAAGELSPAANELIQIAHKNSGRLTRLIDDLLDMERLTAGKLRFQSERVELNSLVSQLLAEASTFAQRRNIRFLLHCNAEEVFVLADSQRLAQVLNNLLSNAAKFSPDNGEVDVDVVRSEGYCQIAVSNGGPGIPRSFQSRIFERFTRGPSEHNGNPGGSGLGLAISKELTEHMGGEIGFSSEPGHRTLFWIRFPECF